MIKSRKALLASVLCVLLCAAFGMSVLAAPSPSTSGAVQSASGTDANKGSIQIVVSASGQSLSASELQSILGSAYESGMTVLDVKDVSIVTVGDGGTDEIAFPVTITFNVTGVTSSSKVTLLHYVNNAWTVVPCTVGNGTVTASFDSLSPVAFIVDSSTAATASTSVKSPKTGESSFGWIACIAAIAAVGTAAAVYSRKRA